MSRQNNRNKFEALDVTRGNLAVLKQVLKETSGLCDHFIVTKDDSLKRNTYGDWTLPILACKSCILETWAQGFEIPISTLIPASVDTQVVEKLLIVDMGANFSRILSSNVSEVVAFCESVKNMDEDSLKEIYEENEKMHALALISSTGLKNAALRKASTTSSSHNM